MWVLLALLAAAGTATGEEETPDTWDGKQFVKASEADQIPEPKINIPGLETDSKMARLNEQELMDPNIPHHMQCDACGAVSFQLGRALQKKSAGKGGQRLRSYELLDVLDGVCSAGTGELVDREGGAYDWGEYSIKNVQSKPPSFGSMPTKAEINPSQAGLLTAGLSGNVLSGPGTRTPDQMGFEQYGGMNGRLSRKCTELVGQADEDEIFEASIQCADGEISERCGSEWTVKDSPLMALMCSDICRAGGKGGKAPKKTKKTKQKSKKKKQKQAKEL